MLGREKVQSTSGCGAQKKGSSQYGAVKHECMTMNHVMQLPSLISTTV